MQQFSEGGEGRSRCDVTTRIATSPCVYAEVGYEIRSGQPRPVRKQLLQSRKKPHSLREPGSQPWFSSASDLEDKAAFNRILNQVLGFSACNSGR